MNDDAQLQPLLTHLYGSTIGRTVAGLADAKEGERVVILNAEQRGSRDWPLPDMTGPDRPDYITVPDPLPVIEFQQIDEVGTGLSEGWDLLVGFPPQGTRDKDAFTELLRQLCATANEGARAFLLLVQGLLGRRDPTLRRPLLELGRVETLVFTDIPGGAREKPGLPTSAPLAVALWLPAIGSGQKPTDVRRVGGDEASFKVSLTSVEPWTVAGLDPQRAQKLARWAERSDARPLEELAQLPRGDLEFRDDLRVLMPGQVTERGIDWDGSTRAYDKSRDGRLVELLPGDIVGRTIGDPSWVLLTDDDLDTPTGATKQVTVIRAKGVDPRYMLAFLHSDAAALQLERSVEASTIPRVSTRALRELLVPMVLVGSHALLDRDPVQELRVTSRNLADQLDDRYRSSFDKPDAEAVTAALRDAAEDARMAVNLLRRVTSPLHRARQFLPHPLARTIRVFENHQRADSEVDVFNDLLRFGETAIILLGAVGLAYKQDIGQEIDTEWEERFRQSGVSLGTWLKAANSGAEAARRDDDDLGGLASALSTNSPLNQALNQFLTVRQDNSHGAGPRSPFEYHQAAIELEEALHLTVEELAPFARADWFVVEQISWLEDEKRFTISGRSLKGDHPDFERWTGQRDAPLVDGRVYTAFGDVTLSLSGFCQLRACSVCLHEELYYPDRQRGTMARLRSLDRGHQTEVDLGEIGLPLSVQS